MNRIFLRAFLYFDVGGGGTNLSFENKRIIHGWYHH